MSEIKKEPKKIQLGFVESDPLVEAANEQNEAILKNALDVQGSLIKEIVKGSIKENNKKRPARIAFTENPNIVDSYAGIYKVKRYLVPDSIIKQVRVQNFLVAGILRTRANMLSMFGRARKDRFDIGVDITIKPEFLEQIEPDQLEIVNGRINKAMKFILNCGYTEGLTEREKMTFSNWLEVQCSNAMAFSRIGNENILDDNGNLHRFRPVDIGTFYHTVKKGESTAESIRRASVSALKMLTGENISRQIGEGEDLNQAYEYIQVVDGVPRQAFTSKELSVYHFSNSTDIEHNGYPVTIMDTIMTSITTHTSIEVYNKLYFQNGRAAKGMVVVQSDEIDQSQIEDIKQQFNASINSVSNSFRTPIFGVGSKDLVNWVSTSPQRKDGEFSYLADFTSRNILMAFNMSADELPSYGYLSRATNSQALSESSNEFKLSASRDSGIRPLILKFEDFLNNKLFPLIDAELAQICDIVLAGFDAETKERESVRIQRDMPLFYDYDRLMQETDSEKVGKFNGGNLPFNEPYRQILDQYQDVKDIKMEFFEDVAAYLDPLLKYKKDPFWMQNIQTLAQFNPEAVAAYYATRTDAFEILKMLVEDNNG